METGIPKRSVLRMVIALIGILLLFIVYVVYPLVVSPLSERVIVEQASFIGFLGLVLMGIAVAWKSKHARTLFGIGAVIIVINQLIFVYETWEFLLAIGTKFIQVFYTWFDSVYNFGRPTVIILAFALFALCALMKFNKVIAWITFSVAIILLATLGISLYLWSFFWLYWPYVAWDLGTFLLCISYILFLLQEVAENRRKLESGS